MFNRDEIFLQWSSSKCDAPAEDIIYYYNNIYIQTYELKI